MTDIFLFKKPVDFVKAYIESLSPTERRGINGRLSKAAGVFPSYFSLILSGERSLNTEQALGIANYMLLGTWQKRYFLRMADYDRAGSEELRQELSRELEELRLKHHQISGVVPHENVLLSSEDTTRFYSSWVYAAIRLASVLPESNTLEDIAKRLNIPLKECSEAMDFLLDKGLCIQEGTRFNVGPAHMHLGNDSYQIGTHHSQWRLQAMSRHASMKSTSELAYSVALCLSKEDVTKVRSLLLDSIKKVREVSDPSPSETLYLLNLDWLEV
ncbi:TIGR02147 family protein [Bdellovibrio sp. HCB288]|uniref:TIGR02147 family protein n=1 Tax=Bdellovibrio sp. HCB288 TaxID=3394355 RepID=UPI0039B3D424